MKMSRSKSIFFEELSLFSSENEDFKLLDVTKCDNFWEIGRLSTIEGLLQKKLNTYIYESTGERIVIKKNFFNSAIANILSVLGASFIGQAFGELFTIVIDGKEVGIFIVNRLTKKSEFKINDSTFKIKDDLLTVLFVIHQNQVE